MARTIMDFINEQIEKERRKGDNISLEEWTEIRRSNDWDAIAEAWQRVEQAGGYSNLV